MHSLIVLSYRIELALNMQDSHFRVWYLFLAQVVAIAAVLHWFGKFEPTDQIDTASYRDYSIGNVEASLNDKRTFVYPLVLRGFESADGSERLVPWFQYLLAALSVGVFLAALLRSGWNPWMALAGASPILTSQIVVEYTGVLTPDLLAQSLAITSVAFWLLVVHVGNQRWALLGLSIFVFLTYQTKPSYLGLLAFVPVGGWIARWWLHAHRNDAWRIAFGLAVASVMPFLLWCSMRWFVVGHFGLVSFGGYNIIGIAGQVLEPDRSKELSAEVQPLANEIVKRREALKGWQNNLDYDTVESQFNPMVWTIAVPAASELCESDSREMNRIMASLSKQVLLGNPQSYAEWLIKAAKRSVRVIVELTLRNPISLLSIAIAIIAFGAGWQCDTSDSRRGGNMEFEREFQMLTWTAIGFAVCKLGLVILVEPPIERYCAPASVFLPSLVAMFACRMVLRAQGRKSTTKIEPSHSPNS